MKHWRSIPVTGKEIRTLRQAIGLNQTEFAKLVDADLSQLMVSRWEREVHKPHKFHRALLEQVQRNYQRGVYDDLTVLRYQLRPRTVKV